MWRCETTMVWRSGYDCRLHAAGNPEVAVATSPRSGGPHNTWTAEGLFVGAVGVGLMTSSLGLLRKANIGIRSYMGNVTGEMEDTSDGLLLTGVDVQISIAVTEESDVEPARHAAMMSGNTCAVYKALKCPASVTVRVNVYENGEA